MNVSIAHYVSQNVQWKQFMRKMMCLMSSYISSSLNAELSKKWRPIIEKKDPLPDADDWASVKDKLDQITTLNRNGGNLIPHV
jgi:hypothetical protein